MADPAGTTEIERAPDSGTHASWRSRRGLAMAIKFVALILPIACSLAWVILIPAILPNPQQSLEYVGWWFIVLGGAITMAIFTEKLARKLLPLAILFRLALAFPEAAPSRFAVALRASSVRDLKKQLEEGTFTTSDDVQECAEQLLGLSAALSAHDRMTRGHGERVRAYAALVGEEMGLPQHDLDRLQWAALLHDVGKLDVAPEILNKPGRLTDFEWESMHEHPEAGERYIATLRPWLGEWADAVSGHHEHFDGAGYPDGASGVEISLSARIVAVVDAYDVMTSVRSYKEPMSQEAALAELKDKAGTQFDPAVVRAFLSISTAEIVPPARRVAALAGVVAVLRFADLRAVAVGAAATAAAAVAIAGAPEVNDFSPESLAFTEATPTSVAVEEDRSLAIDLSTNRAADSYSIESIEGPATATIEESQLVIEPTADESGTVTVIVTACGDGGCDTTTIVAEVVAVNDPPFATVDEAEVQGGQTSVVIPVLENDSDAEDRGLRIESAELTEGEGTVSIVNNETELDFRPEVESLGPWTIEYVVTDGEGGFDRGIVTILDGNLAPTGEADTETVEVLQSVRFDPRENDVDDGGRADLRIVEVSDPSDGTVRFGDDWVEYTADADPGVGTFSYVVADAMGRTDVVEVTIDVTAAPLVVVNDVATTKEDTAITIDVLANDGPAAAQIDPRTLQVLTASSGSVSVGGGVITYEPPENAAGEASILYEVCTVFGECAQGVVQVTVESVNDITTFTADGEIRIPSGAGPQVIPWAVVSSGEAVVPSGSTFSISTDGVDLFDSAPQISTNGAMSFTPKPGAAGTASVTIVANDPTNGQRVFVIRVIVS